jgi:hypothetical protein
MRGKSSKSRQKTGRSRRRITRPFQAPSLREEREFLPVPLDFYGRWLCEFDRARKGAGDIRAKRRDTPALAKYWYSPTLHWEGAKVVGEINAAIAKGVSSELGVESELRTKDPGAKFVTSGLLTMILRDIDIYRAIKGRVVETNKNLQQAIAGVRKFKKELWSFERRVPAHALNTAQAYLDEAQGVLEVEAKDYWSVHLDPLARERQREFSISDPNIVKLSWYFQRDALLARLRVPTALSKEKNVETRFQVRLAAALRAHLSFLSLRTVSRLVVLCYICAELCEEREHKLIVATQAGQRRVEYELTVDMVYKKLRKAGMRACSAA